MKKTKFLSRLVAIVMVLTLAISVNVFALSVTTQTKAIINNGGDVDWDGDVLTIEGQDYQSVDSSDDGAVSVTFCYGESKTTKTAYFSSEDARAIQQSASDAQTTVTNKKNTSDVSVDGMKDKIKSGVADISDNMQFDVSVKEGLDILGSGASFRGTVSFVFSVIVAIIWIFVLLSTIIDFGCCANPQIAEFCGVNGGSAGSEEGKSTAGSFLGHLVTPACKKAISEAESHNKNAVLCYIKKGSIHIIAVIIATIVIPSGGLFTFINWLLGFFM